MAGRHRLEPGESLDAFLAERRASLEAGGALTRSERAEQRVGSITVLTLSAHATSDAGDIAVRLLVLRTKPDEGVSLLLVGDPTKAGRIDSTWAAVVGSLGMEAE